MYTNPLTLVVGGIAVVAAVAGMCMYKHASATRAVVSLRRAVLCEAIVSVNL